MRGGEGDVGDGDLSRDSRGVLRPGSYDGRNRLPPSGVPLSILVSVYVLAPFPSHNPWFYPPRTLPGPVVLPAGGQHTRWRIKNLPL